MQIREAFVELLDVCRQAAHSVASDGWRIEEAASDIVAFILLHDELLGCEGTRALLHAAGVAELDRETSYAQPIGMWDAAIADRRKREEWEKVRICMNDIAGYLGEGGPVF